MINKELYKKTTDILINAYIKGTLKHGSCSACAVGNLCGNRRLWSFVITTTGQDGFKHVQNFFKKYTTNPQINNMYDQARKLAHQTGYTPSQLERIEDAFEMSLINSKEGYEYWVLPENEDEGQYMGLIAVMDVLNDIHQVGETNVKSRLDIAFSNKCES